MISATDPRHGTRNGYRAGCRETCCVEANRAYFAAYYETYRPHLGYQPLVNATPILTRLDDLAALNINPSAIAQAVGVDDSAIRYLYDNRPPVVQQATYDRLINLHPADIVTPFGLGRRIRALAALGWPVSYLARETGLDKEPLRRLRDGIPQQYVQAHVRDAILAAYDRLQMRGPEIHTTPDRRAVSRALNTARKNRWAPPLAWDNIDDPYEVPDATYAPTKRADLDEFTHLIRGGESITRAAARLGVTVAAIDQAARRAGRADLVELVATELHHQRKAAA